MSSAFRACRFLLAPTKSAGASAAAKAKPKPKAKPNGDAHTPRQSGGLQKPYQVSPALASFVGASESSRANAVKEVWAHIKLHNLQNPANKKEINCDNKLKALFDGRDKVHFLEISKLLNSHFVKNN